MSWKYSVIRSDKKVRKVLAVGLISLLLLSVLSMGCIEEESQDTPESTFSLFVERINDEDGEGVIELFDSGFVDEDIWEEDEVSEHEEGFKEELNSTRDAIDNGELEVDSYDIDITFMEDMDEKNKTEYENLTETLNENEYFDADVDDLCMVDYDWDATVEENSTLEYWVESEGTGENGEMDTKLFMLEIEDEWYIGFNGASIIFYQELGDLREPLTGNIDAELIEEEGEEDSINVTFQNLEVPSSASLTELSVKVDGEEQVDIAADYIENPDNWIGLSEENEVVAASQLTISEGHADISFPEQPNLVIINIDGYEGALLGSLS